MRTTRKKPIFKAMKFRTIEIAKFYSSEIKWVYKIYFVARVFSYCLAVSKLTLLCWRP